jgi:hypothetical protein
MCSEPQLVLEEYRKKRFHQGIFCFVKKIATTTCGYIWLVVMKDAAQITNVVCGLFELLVH